jgi:hypothetical protein
MSADLSQTPIQRCLITCCDAPARGTLEAARTRFPKVGTVASRDGIVGPVNGRAPFVGIRTDNYDTVQVHNNYVVAEVGFQADNVNEHNAIGNVHVVSSAIPTDFWAPDVT